MQQRPCLRSKKYALLYLFILSAWWLSMPAAAQSIQPLANSTAWLKLGHYHSGWTGLRSDVDSGEFFLHPNGKYNPQAELQATIDALTAPTTEDANQHAVCRFPARYQLIKQHITLPPATADIICDEYLNFLQRWQPAQVTLIFADAYLNNPASSFGHTFLRLDPAPDSQGNHQPALLNGTIDFAAHTDGIGGFMYAYNGLVGRFPGRFSVLPYYIQVNEYNYGALRDLWEYPVKLTAAEQQQLMAHLWELRDAVFDYYFVDENCSGQLLALLEAVKPELELLQQVGATVIPGEMVRALADEQLLGAPHFRPALDSIIATAGQSLTPKQQALSRQFASIHDNPDEHFALLAPQLQQYTPQTQARILDIAYDLLRLYEQNGSISADELQQQGGNLLIARAKLSIASDFPAVPAPDEQPARDHGAVRIRLGLQTQAQQTAVLGWRLVYHDLLDPRLASPRGTEIRAFDFTAQWRAGDWTLNQADLLSLRSLNPRGDLIKPTSWQLKLSYNDNTFGTIGTAEYGRGYSWSTQGIQNSNEKDEHLWFVLGVAELQAGHGLQHAWRLGGGIQLGWLHTPDPWTSTLVELDIRDGLAGDDRTVFTGRISQQWSFTQNLGLRLQLEQQRRHNHIHNTGQLTLEWYL